MSLSRPMQESGSRAVLLEALRRQPLAGSRNRRESCIVMGVESTRAWRDRMASDRDFVEFVADQMEGAGAISHRRMFGEYAIYCDGKVVALVCDNRLFVKPTAAGREFIGEPAEAPPYPGAKPWFLVDDYLEDGDRIRVLIRMTAGELPPPRLRPTRKR